MMASLQVRAGLVLLALFLTFVLAWHIVVGGSVTVQTMDSECAPMRSKASLTRAELDNEATAARLYGADVRTVLPRLVQERDWRRVLPVVTASSGIKLLFRDDTLAPDVICYDPTLALATPLDLWLSTGIRSVDHASEKEAMLGHRHASRGLGI